MTSQSDFIFINILILFAFIDFFILLCLNYIINSLNNKILIFFFLLTILNNSLKFKLILKLAKHLSIWNP